jgi:alanyl-tRNA synthetase
MKSKLINELTSNNQQYIIKDLLSKAIEILGKKIIISNQENLLNIKEFGDKIRDYSSSNTIAVIGTIINSKPMIMCMVTKDLENDISAKKVILLLAPIIDGGGGGRDSIATAGGKKVDGLDEALRVSRRIIEDLLNEK